MRFEAACWLVKTGLHAPNLRLMSNKRVLVINQETAPFLPESINSVYGRDMLRGLAEKGFEVRTFMPKFGSINERRNQLHEVIRLSGMNIPINDSDHPLIIKVASLQPSRIQVYFMDNDDYFQKSADDVDPIGSNRADNDERALFFAHSSMETVKKLRWDPAIIHCQGWFSAFLPVYLRKMFASEPGTGSCKVVYSVTDSKPYPKTDSRFYEELKLNGFPEEDIEEFKDMPFDADTLHKLAIKHSDGVVFATPDVSESIKEYVKSAGIPYLEYDKIADGNFDAYKEFYSALKDEK